MANDINEYFTLPKSEDGPERADWFTNTVDECLNGGETSRRFVFEFFKNLSAGRVKNISYHDQVMIVYLPERIRSLPDQIIGCIENFANSSVSPAVKGLWIYVLKKKKTRIRNCPVFVKGQPVYVRPFSDFLEPTGTINTMTTNEEIIVRLKATATYITLDCGIQLISSQPPEDYLVSFQEMYQDSFGILKEMPLSYTGHNGKLICRTFDRAFSIPDCDV